MPINIIESHCLGYARFEAKMFFPSTKRVFCIFTNLANGSLNGSCEYGKQFK